MDNRERLNDPEESMRTALDGKQAEMWTALPGVIVSFNAAACTAQVQPTIQGSTQNEQGDSAAVNLPVLPDVPVIFPRGGNFILSFPIKEGDEVLVVFASRCIDSWWQSGGVQQPAEDRMHDLSDGFAIPGPFSQATAISDISTEATQLRTLDGQTFIELSDTGVKMQTSGAMLQVEGGNVSVMGNLSINGQPYVNHQHNNVTNGGDISGGVV